MTTTLATRGGAWLIEEAGSDSLLTPERLTEEHRLIGRTADEFIDNEVLPVLFGEVFRCEHILRIALLGEEAAALDPFRHHLHVAGCHNYFLCKCSICGAPWQAARRCQPAPSDASQLPP